MAALIFTVEHFTDGEEVPSEGEGTFETVNPATARWRTSRSVSRPMSVEP